MENIKDWNTVLLTNKEVIKYETTPLETAGEAFRSKLLNLRVTHPNEEVELVAKICYKNRMYRLMFDVYTRFKRELDFYEIVLPAFLEFLNSRNIKIPFDFFPKFYGGRITSNPDAIIDQETIILIENLYSKNFQFITVEKGFNFQQSKVILKDLARFHAVSFAFKLQNPKYFQEKLLPLLDCRYDEDRPSETFSMLIHGDFWIYNILVNSQEPISVKFLDFQDLKYGSSAVDLCFFLFSSVNEEVLFTSSDELVEIYYTQFISTLQLFDCNVNELPFAKFKQDIYRVSERELSRSLFTVNPPHTLKPQPPCTEDDHDREYCNIDGDCEMVEFEISGITPEVMINNLNISK